MLSSSRATTPAKEINDNLISGLLSSRARYLFATEQFKDAGVQEVYRAGIFKKSMGARH
jgi:hypothetical protein